MIFDVKEFSVNDGPGTRQTVFFKGCPLRCNWCHNPEGLETYPQLMVRHTECLHCGRCAAACRRLGRPADDTDLSSNSTHQFQCTKSGSCIACGDCVRACPLRLRSVCGYEISAEDLAGILLKNKSIYEDMGGGVTFSGGEPLMQPEFLLEVIDRLAGMHIAIETCGYATEKVFASAIEKTDLVMLDIKLADGELHKRYCGADNAPIQKNLSILIEGKTSFIVRVPLIPGVTDSESNLRDIARLLEGAGSLLYVELLPYNRLAGAKYGQLGLVYRPDFDTERALHTADGIFEQFGIESKVL